jgi:hypothetical protein
MQGAPVPAAAATIPPTNISSARPDALLCRYFTAAAPRARDQLTLGIAGAGRPITPA